MRKIPEEPLAVETLVISHEVKNFHGNSGRYQPSRFIRRETFGFNRGHAFLLRPMRSLR